MKRDLKKFTQELEAVFKKHGLQIGPDYEYGDYSFTEYTPGIGNDILDSIEAQERAAEAQRIATAKYEKARATCDGEGHLWGEWAFRSNTSVGNVQSRKCSRCSDWQTEQL